MQEIDVEIKGFEELAQKIKQLPDRVKRTEVLKIQRQLAKPIVQAYQSELPESKVSVRRFGNTYPAGTLKKSVAVVTVPIGKSGGNPAVKVRPWKRGKYDSWYRFMVIPKGSNPGSNKRGSRQNINVVVEAARDRAINRQQEFITKKYLDSVSKYVQKNIDKLSER